MRPRAMAAATSQPRAPPWFRPRFKRSNAGGGRQWWACAAGAALAGTTVRPAAPRALRTPGGATGPVLPRSGDLLADEDCGYDSLPLPRSWGRSSIVLLARGGLRGVRHRSPVSSNAPGVPDPWPAGGERAAACTRLPPPLSGGGGGGTGSRCRVRRGRAEATCGGACVRAACRRAWREGRGAGLQRRAAFAGYGALNRTIA